MLPETNYPVALAHTPSEASSSPKQEKGSPIFSFIGLAAFCLLEAGFFAFAFLCHGKGSIPLEFSFKNQTGNSTFHSYLSQGTAGYWTVLNNVWHTVAITLGGSIVMETFVKEWSSRKAFSLQDFKEQHMNKVFSPLAGHQHRLLYCRNKAVTASFRVAFLASLGMIALRSVAPGSIGAVEAPYHVLHDLPIGVFLHDFPVNDQNSNSTQILSTLLLSLDRSAEIVRTEQLEGQTYGYVVPLNSITAWPVPSDLSFLFEGTYNSDVVNFKHACHWEEPEFIDTSTIAAGGLQWDATPFSILNSSELALDPSPINGSAVLPLIQLFDSPSQLMPMSAYMFLGGNDTTSAIDLSGLPIFQDGSAIRARSPDLLHQDQIIVTAPLATVLICQPKQFWRLGGTVRIEVIGTNSLYTVPYGEEVGNISEEAINILFSLGLYQSIAQADPIAERQSDGTGDRIRVNFAATQLFIGDVSDWSKATGRQPLDLDSIALTMDQFMTSAAKGLAQGYRAAGDDTSLATYENKTIQAEFDLFQIQLVASIGPLFGAIALFALILPLLITLHVSAMRHPDRMIFDVPNILRVVDSFGINASDGSFRDKNV